MAIAQHTTFTLERVLKVSPAKAFSAWSDPAKKKKWFIEQDGPAWETLHYEMDFREGGQETGSFRNDGGPVHRNNTVYLDIVENERIVMAYTMSMDDNRISASLATVLFEPLGDGTKLTYTDQLTSLEGGDPPEVRQMGWNYLLDAFLAAVE